MGSCQARLLPCLQSHLHIDKRHVVNGGKTLDCDGPAGLHVSSEITDLGACTRAGFTGINAVLVSMMVIGDAEAHCLTAGCTLQPHKLHGLT